MPSIIQPIPNDAHQAPACLLSAGDPSPLTVGFASLPTPHVQGAGHIAHAASCILYWVLNMGRTKILIIPNSLNSDDLVRLCSSLIDPGSPGFTSESQENFLEPPSSLPPGLSPQPPATKSYLSLVKPVTTPLHFSEGLYLGF